MSIFSFKALVSLPSSYGYLLATKETLETHISIKYSMRLFVHSFLVPSLWSKFGLPFVPLGLPMVVPSDPSGVSIFNVLKAVGTTCV